MVFVNNWHAEPDLDQLVVFEINQPQNHIEPVETTEPDQFRSKIDQNLIYLSDQDSIYEDAWVYKFTINKNAANLIRSQFDMFISFQYDSNCDKVKTLWDGEHNFNPLESKILNIYLTFKNFEKKRKLLSGDLSASIRQKRND